MTLKIHRFESITPVNVTDNCWQVLDVAEKFEFQSINLKKKEKN